MRLRLHLRKLRPWADGIMVGLFIFYGAACEITTDFSMSGQPHDCGMLSCESGVSFHTEFLATRADIPELEIQACRNQSCVLTRPALVPGGTTFSCASFGPLVIDCELVPPTDGTSTITQLDMYFAGRTEDFRDGDSYSVRAGKPGAAPLFSVEKSVDYAASRPNGSSCNPLCLNAEL